MVGLSSGREALSHASRHFLGLQSTTLAVLPFNSERLVAVGAFEQDAEQHRLAIIHLRGGNDTSSSAEAVELAAWVPPAPVTSTAAVVVSSSASSSDTSTTLLVAGCRDGSLCRLRISYPRAPPGGGGGGAGGERGGANAIEQTSLDDGDFDGTDLVPWVPALHRGAVTSVAVGGGTGGDAFSACSVVATSGADGSIALTPADASSHPSSSSRLVVGPRPAASVSSVAWVGGDTLAAAGTASPIELFDVRSSSSSSSAGGGRPAARAPPASDPCCCSSLSPSSSTSVVAVHAARPNLATTGGKNGISLWDLRLLGKGPVASLLSSRAGRGRSSFPVVSPLPSSLPLSSTSTSSSPLLDGGITGLVFDPLPTTNALLGDATPRLLFSTGLGVVGSARLSAANEASFSLSSSAGGASSSSSTASLLYKEQSASALALAVEPPSSSDPGSSFSSSGRDIFVSTDQECLVFLRRPLV